MEKFKRRIVIHKEYNIKGLKDFNFKYDEEKNLYKHGGLICNEKTRELSCSTKASSSDLAVLIDLYELNIAQIDVIVDLSNENEPNEELVKKTTKVARKG